MKSVVQKTCALFLLAALAPQAASANCEMAYRNEIAALGGVNAGLALQTEIGAASTGAAIGGMVALGMFNPVFGVFLGAPVVVTATFRFLKNRKLKDRINSALLIVEAERNQGQRLDTVTAKLVKKGYDVTAGDVANVIVRGNTQEIFCRGVNEPYGKVKLASSKGILKYAAVELASSRRQR